MKTIWLGGWEQKTAACTVLLLFALGCLGNRGSWDQPHVHVDTGSSAPTANVTAISFSGGNTVNVTSIPFVSNFEGLHGV